MTIEMTTVFFKDNSAKFGYRKAIVTLADVEYFKAKGAYSSPKDFPADEAPKRKPGRPARTE